MQLFQGPKMEDFWIRIREEVRGLGIYDRLMGHFWPVFLNNTTCYRDIVVMQKFKILGTNSNYKVQYDNINLKEQTN